MGDQDLKTIFSGRNTHHSSLVTAEAVVYGYPCQESKKRGKAPVLLRVKACVGTGMILGLVLFPLIVAFPVLAGI
jgi:hypothetical protein